MTLKDNPGNAVTL
uniref:Uncharacterized protein n=1 Tax=Schistosoma haematobium TaxID=6185 RepID=A0A094ZFM3_SCHHA